MYLTHCTDREIWLDLQWPYYLSAADEKPSGLWVDAPTSIQDKSWREFVNETGVRDASVRYEVKLNKDAKIALLSSKLDMITFTEEFGIRSTIPISSVTGFSEITLINWEIVSTQYQGILVSPYIYEVKDDLRYYWYRGWDIASGCIWDLNAISKFELID